MFSSVSSLVLWCRLVHPIRAPLPPQSALERGCGEARCPTTCWHGLALVGIGLVCRRSSVSLLLTLPSTGHLFPKRMPSALKGVSAWHLSSWLRCFPTASSVTGRILEVFRYVSIPAAHARMTLPRKPESHSVRLKERLDSFPETPPRLRRDPSVT